MASWRDGILKEFTPQVNRLTLVADPDGLLQEEGILQGIRERGFELIPFEDHVAFRYAYESRYRARWDRGEQTELVVVLRSQAADLGSLPHDLLQAGRRLFFNLGDIFRQLSYPIVATLDRSDLDALHAAQERYAPGQLGENATKEFILRHVFEIAPELIKQPSDLLRVLLRRHYRGQRIPETLDQRLIHLLRQNDAFADWPLETLLPDRDAFLAFIQERWPLYLERLTPDEAPGFRDESQRDFALSIAGPTDLPFDHDDVRVYMTSLFLEGVLEPVAHGQADALSSTWVQVGVRADPVADRSRRLRNLLDHLDKAIPLVEAKHTDWLHFAHAWAELRVLLNGQGGTIPGEILTAVRAMQAQMDDAFASWLARRYAGLVNLPPSPPAMLHHVPRFLARQAATDASVKVALVVVDGLSLDQWLVIRSVLAALQDDVRYIDQAVFAWVPSITPVSRQAALAGKPPLFFPNSIQTTDREQALWTQFWVDQGLVPMEVVYAKGLGDGNLEPVAEALAHPKVRVAGLVVDKVDKIGHGMELGSAGMHNQVRQWAEQPYLRGLLGLLLGRGFRVYLTSDHGNVEAEGCGRPTEGSVAELRGERVRVYPDASLRRLVKNRFPDALEWEPIGLPDSYLPLLAPGRRAFIPEKQRTVSHGGALIEEIIVPLVEITRRSA